MTPDARDEFWYNVLMFTVWGSVLVIAAVVAMATDWKFGWGQ